jgi:TPR repeat protein
MKKNELSVIMQLAQHGNAEAQSQLGKIYFNGEGVPRDRQKAVEWWMKAEQQDDGAAPA